MEIKIMDYKSLYIDGVDVLEGKKAIDYWYYTDGIYKYQTEDKYWHLMIKGKDVLEGKKAIKCYYYDDGIYKYQTEDNRYQHLMINGKDVLQGKKAIDCCYYYGNGVFKYQTEDGEWVEIDLNQPSQGTYDNWEDSLDTDTIMDYLASPTQDRIADFVESKEGKILADTLAYVFLLSGQPKVRTNESGREVITETSIREMNPALLESQRKLMQELFDAAAKLIRGETE
jgi:hypothetical protein